MRQPRAAVPVRSVPIRLPWTRRDPFASKPLAMMATPVPVVPLLPASRLRCAGSKPPIRTGPTTDAPPSASERPTAITDGTFVPETSAPIWQPSTTRPAEPEALIARAKRVIAMPRTVCVPSVVPAAISSPIVLAVVCELLSSIARLPLSPPWSGVLVLATQPGWVVPSIVTSPVIMGSDEATLITCGPVPGIANTISSATVAPLALLSAIACRNEPGPVSAVVVTVKVSATAIDGRTSSSRARQRFMAGTRKGEIAAPPWNAPAAPDRTLRCTVAAGDGCLRARSRRRTAARRIERIRKAPMYPARSSASDPGR